MSQNDLPPEAGTGVSGVPQTSLRGESFTPPDGMRPIPCKGQFAFRHAWVPWWTLIRNRPKWLCVQCGLKVRRG